MAKISTYTNDSSISLGDKLIGTDVDQSDATKNFTIGDIFSFASQTTFVPYTGASQAVDLGAENLTTTGTVDATLLVGQFGIHLVGSGFGVGALNYEGNTGDVLVSQGPGVPPSWSPLSGSYVPYTGATTDVDLGTHKLLATGVDVKTGPLLVNGAPGAVGQVLVSQGAGTNPTWGSVSSSTDYASRYHTLTQIVGAGLSAPIRFNSVGSWPTTPTITVTNDAFGDPTVINCATAGTYSLEVSVNAVKTVGGSDEDIYLFLFVNGLQVQYSGRKWTLRDANHSTGISAKYNLTVAPTDDIQFVWYQTNNIILGIDLGPIPVPSAFFNIFKI